MYRVLLTLSLGMVLATPATAVDRYDYLITSNFDGGGADGVRIALGLDTTPTPEEPCHLTTASNPTVAMPWTVGGTVLGVAKNLGFNATYDYVYASVSESDSNNGCSSALDWCLGTAWYDVSDTDASPSITWSWNAAGDASSEPVVPDVAAFKNATIDTAVLLEKASSGSVHQHVTANPTTNEEYTGMNEMSRVQWTGPTSLPPRQRMARWTGT